MNYHHLARLLVGLGICATLGACQNTTAISSAQRGTCDRPAALLIGYWPPTNEMLRAWSKNPAQNTDGWQGEDWRGLGYDVYAYLPEFPPDGDPTNDDFGSDGWVGSPDSDFRVDFQDTSADFWRVAEAHQPRIIITTSRGNGADWELEAIEGGHGKPASAEESVNPAADWRSDEHGRHGWPSENTIDARSWAGISRYRAGNRLPSTLPLAEIEAATRALDIGAVEIDRTGTSGNYLSGFLGLHGLLYDESSETTIAAGHIHVRKGLAVATARAFMETTLETVLQHHRSPCAL
ncbi:MAG: hypothetical protein AAF515_00680 [Pseudomonadota bacterium]